MCPNSPAGVVVVQRDKAEQSRAKHATKDCEGKKNDQSILRRQYKARGRSGAAGLGRAMGRFNFLRLSQSSLQRLPPHSDCYKSGPILSGRRVLIGSPLAPKIGFTPRLPKTRNTGASGFVVQPYAYLMPVCIKSQMGKIEISKLVVAEVESKSVRLYVHTPLMSWLL